MQGAASFDYENRDVYTFTFAVKDQYLDGLEKKELVLNITNVNEAPTITITQEYITFDEDKVGSYSHVLILIRGVFRNNVDVFNNFTMLCSMVINIISN